MCFRSIQSGKLPDRSGPARCRTGKCCNSKFSYSAYTFQGIFSSCKFSIFDSRDIPGGRLLFSQISKGANGLGAMVDQGGITLGAIEEASRSCHPVVDSFFFLFLGHILFVMCRFFYHICLLQVAPSDASFSRTMSPLGEE